jgi:hypothetical protein
VAAQTTYAKLEFYVVSCLQTLNSKQSEISCSPSDATKISKFQWTFRLSAFAIAESYERVLFLQVLKSQETIQELAFAKLAKLLSSFTAKLWQIRQWFSSFFF